MGVPFESDDEFGFIKSYSLNKLPHVVLLVLLLLNHLRGRPNSILRKTGMNTQSIRGANLLGKGHCLNLGCTQNNRLEDCRHHKHHNIS
jgi:hypothetical protein